MQRRRRDSGQHDSTGRDVAELVVENHPESESLHVDFVME